MATVALTAAQIGFTNETEAEIKDFIAGETITAGQAVYLKSDGKVWLARANAAATAVVKGIAMVGASAGRPVAVISRGSVFGFALASNAYDLPIYLSSGTAGALDDAVITGTDNFVICIGRIVALADTNLTKVLFVDVPFSTTYTALP